ncbi:MAG: hypothetical protein JXR64_14095 [Spirochaetales bacterium]|nr:hypothetical protein [Spirochaetales bacterium]
MGLYYIKNVDRKQNKITLYKYGLLQKGKEPLVIFHKDTENEVYLFEKLFGMARVLNVSLVVQYDEEKGIILN